MNRIIRHIINKFIITINRIGFYIIQIPIRVVRLLQHLYDFFGFFDQKEEFSSNFLESQLNTIGKIGVWFLELFFYISDLFAIGEVYSILVDWIKINSRNLNKDEIQLANSVYENAINLKVISIDESSYLGIKWRPVAKAYATFHHINTWNKMENSVFIHELIHIWQYQKFGSVYLVRALLAQYSEKKYNYGGIAAIKKAIAKRWNLQNFNYEQQGDIVQDYYRIREGYPPLWGMATIQDLDYYEYFIKQIKEKK